MFLHARLRIAFVGVATGMVLLGAPSALAHPLVDDGMARLRAADFRAALTTFDRAEAATDLTLADLLVLLEGRAMAALALHDEDAVGANLARLAAIQPDHRFGAEAPPEIRAAFARARGARSGPLSLELRSTRDAAAVTLEAVVQGDPGGLVRSVELAARTAGGAWRQWARGRGRLVAPADQLVEAHAAAHGPGGAIVAEAGRREAPIRIEPAASGAAVGDGSQAEGGGARDRDEDGGGAGTWAWIGVGAALVAAGVVIAIVASSSGGTSDVTQVGAPEPPR